VHESAEAIKRVLVVEDDADDVLLIERVFDRLPAAVEIMHLEDGNEVLAFSEAWEPLGDFFDLVLLDSKVPGATGLEMLQALRKVDPLSRVPIVLLVGAAGDDFSDIAMGHGADSCVIKPLVPEMFMDKVRRIAVNWLELENA